MKIFLYNSVTFEEILTYESDIAPMVGDIYTQTEIAVGPGEVVKRIIHIEAPYLLTLHIKVSPKIF